MKLSNKTPYLLNSKKLNDNHSKNASNDTSTKSHQRGLKRPSDLSLNTTDLGTSPNQAIRMQDVQF